MPDVKDVIACVNPLLAPAFAEFTFEIVEQRREICATESAPPARKVASKLWV